MECVSYAFMNASIALECMNNPDIYLENFELDDFFSMYNMGGEL